MLRQEWDDNLLCMAFSVHDLQRDFMKQSAENQMVSVVGKQKKGSQKGLECIN